MRLSEIVTLIMLAIMAVSSSPSVGLPQNLKLASNSKATAVIVVNPAATAPEKFAAEELKSYLGKITGGKFQTVNFPEQNKVCILVGQSPEVRNLLPGIKWDALKPDTIIIKVVGNKLILAGDRPRGTVYAVYTFLEEQLGCKWWTQTDSYVPKKRDIAVKSALNKVYAPPFHYRAMLYKFMEREPGPFGARLKLNGDFPTPGDLYGGHQSTIKMGHSFHYILPPATYFGPHPEWYGLYNGVRCAIIAGGRPNQMCLSNVEMRKELVKRALELIKADPSAGVISIGQEDGTAPCSCADCLALDTKLGGQTGTLLWFVNNAADEIKKVYPKIMVETLAYQWSINPPTIPTKTRDNVSIRVTTINAEFATPWNSPRNVAFNKLVQDWKKVTSNLAIYDYPFNYHNLLISFPIWNAMGANVRYYAANNVTSVMYQGDDYNDEANFIRLRAWLLAHFMWDPTVNQEQIMRQFLNGYYGAAGPYLEKYINLTAQAALQNTTFMACWSDDVCFLTPAQLKLGKTLFDKAEAAVAGNKILLNRVKVERLGFDQQLLLSRLVMPEVQTFVSDAYRDDRARKFIDLSKSSGNDFIGEGVKLRSDYFDILTGRKEVNAYGQLLPATRKPASIPAACAGLSTKDWSDVQEAQFMPGSVCSAIEDPEASNGVAIKLSAGPNDWALQAPVFSRNCIKPAADLYISLKLDAIQVSGPAFAIKVYNLATGEYALNRTVDIKEFAGSSGYTEIKIGTFKPSEAQYIVFVPLDNEVGVRSFAVDRFFFVKGK